MKIKKIAILMSLVLVAASLPAAAKFAVTDIEYLKGEDFVQLHFVANALIPIPDLFYPNENNTRIVVMRIPDVDFNVKKNQFFFKSPVVKSVNIKKKDKFVDVRIKLIEKVNYRVFTNQDGLFVEFPNIEKSQTVLARNNTQNKIPNNTRDQKKNNNKKQRNQKKEKKPAVVNASPTPPPTLG